MEIEHLHEFTVIAKLGSYSRAAEELCISQSALSKHIQALEQELGSPLLVRKPRSVELSPTGADILPMAAQIYALQNQIRVAADRRFHREKARLRLASIPVMAQYNVTELLAKFQRLHPEVTLEVTECEQRELYAQLEQGACELAVSREFGVWEESSEYLPFCRDNLVAVIPRDHPLSGRSSICLEELRLEPLLFLDQRTGLYELCDTLCRRAGVLPNVVYTGHRPENLVALCAQGVGIAMLMKRHTDYVQDPAVACIDIAPAVESTICLVRDSRQPMTTLAEAFWKFVAGNSLSRVDSETE